MYSDNSCLDAREREAKTQLQINRSGLPSAISGISQSYSTRLNELLCSALCSMFGRKVVAITAAKGRIFTAEKV